MILSNLFPLLIHRYFYQTQVTRGGFSLKSATLERNVGSFRVRAFRESFAIEPGARGIPKQRRLVSDDKKKILRYRNDNDQYRSKGFETFPRLSRQSRLPKVSRFSSLLRSETFSKLSSGHLPPRHRFLCNEFRILDPFEYSPACSMSRWVFVEFDSDSCRVDRDGSSLTDDCNIYTSELNPPTAGINYFPRISRNNPSP